MKKKIRILVIVLLVAAGAAAVGAAGVWRYLDTPAGSDRLEKYVEIPPGAHFMEVAGILEREGIIRGVRRFRWLAWFKGNETRIKAGEYAFYAAMRPSEVLDRMVRGESRTIRVTIPEGFTMRQIADLLAKKELADGEAFFSLASEAQFARSLGIQGDSLEGFLFPDTYHFTKSMGEKRIAALLVGRFLAVFNDGYRRRLEELHMTLEELVTLASIIEKETADPAERPLISAVLHNRLKEGMPLQSDPTVIYGLAGFNGNLTKDDLQKAHPYNTYLIKGLPPHPIANPGEASLKAALFPDAVPYRYFVSKNNGTHHFSTTREEHERAVVEYQRNRQSSPPR
jgi:UPF0755 protein